ncbi:MAG TPA: class I SAM-dependent methyltransferase, partial [Anaerolineae bacterium]|nr:class I SAM-dependent methyltransferase [Anaerolineae bacterium]
MPTREEIIVQNVTPFLKPDYHILEIGAGNGLVAEMLHRTTGANFTLLDVVDYNRSAFPLHLYDGRALPFDDNTFDLSLLIFVLHHNPDPRPVLREA